MEYDYSLSDLFSLLNDLSQSRTTHIPQRRYIKIESPNDENDSVVYGKQRMSEFSPNIETTANDTIKDDFVKRRPMRPMACESGRVVIDVLRKQVVTLTKDCYYLLSLLTRDGGLEIDDSWPEGKQIEEDLKKSQNLCSSDLIDFD